MNILLLGKNGQLGWELQRSLALLGQVTALARDSQTYCGDMGDLAGLADTVRALRPDVIVNAAAYTAVDQAEAEPERARLLNATAVGLLAEETARLGAWLLHYSTDYVFDGSGSRPWTEADIPAPLSVYGHTKWEGEQLIRQTGCRHLIFRTSWVYAARGGNFAKTMLRLAQTRERLTVVDDQWGAPTGADMLADASAHALRHVMQRPEAAGLYHCAASGATTWFAYAQHVIERARRMFPEKAMAVQNIVPVPSNAFASLAPRPKNSRLDTSKLCSTFGLTLPHWQPGIARMLAEMPAL